MKKSKTLLAVFAHPDDETFICGGTLAKYAGEGVSITLVSATKGEMGRRMGKPPFANRETMPKLREQELVMACKHLSINDLRFLNIRDKTVEFVDQEALTGTIVRLIREIKPDVMLTFHERWGGHPDHCAIGRAATAAFRQSGDPGCYRDQLQQGLEPFAPPRLYFISFGDTMKQPEAYGLTREQITVIDISAFRREKMLAYRDHRSQSEINEWLWGPDQDVVARFGKQEYFIQGNGGPRSGETDLFP